MPSTDAWARTNDDESATRHMTTRLRKDFIVFSMGRPALTPHAGYAGARASVYVEFLTNPSIREYSFFAQDEWRIDRDLTINAGLRYDLQQFAKPDVRNPDAHLAAAIDTRHLPRPKPSRMKQVFAPGLGRCLRPAERGKRNRAAAKRSHRGAVLGGLRRSFAAFLPTDTNNWGPRLGVTSAPPARGTSPASATEYLRIPGERVEPRATFLVLRQAQDERRLLE